MPIYEYRCQECSNVFSHHFRTLRAADEEGFPPCPACGAREVQRLLSTVSMLGGGEGGAGEATEETATPGKPRLFGRKELNQVIEERKRAG